jgi:class 3 adenylate cyclase
MHAAHHGTVPLERFAADHTYDNVFLIFLDSAGHSSIVAGNPRDRAGRAFDLLRDRVADRLETIARERRCERAELWRWAGDGGFLAVHDRDESIARDVALEFVRSLLELDLHHVRDELHRLEIGGELHLRIAVHRGPIRYLGVGEEGSIYSPDINFTAHLERAAPPDTAVISADVYQVAGRFASMFEPVGTFEGRLVYVYTGPAGPGSGVRRWLSTHGLRGARPVFGYPERPHQIEKARLVRAAATEVLYLGSALRSTARCLVTTERPAYLRDATLDFLQRGGRFRCVLMDPDCDAAHLLSLQHREDFASKIKESLAGLKRFKDRAGPDGERVEVYQTTIGPTMSCLAIDLDEPHALILASPYLTAPTAFREQVDGLSELPHFLIARQAGRVFDNLGRLVRAFVEEDVKRIL